MASCTSGLAHRHAIFIRSLDFSLVGQIDTSSGPLLDYWTLVNNWQIFRSIETTPQELELLLNSMSKQTFIIHHTDPYPDGPAVLLKFVYLQIRHQLMDQIMFTSSREALQLSVKRSSLQMLTWVRYQQLFKNSYKSVTIHTWLELDGWSILCREQSKLSNWLFGIF